MFGLIIQVFTQNIILGIIKTYIIIYTIFYTIYTIFNLYDLFIYKIHTENLIFYIIYLFRT